MIEITMSGKILDALLLELYSAETADNNGKLICIKDGRLDFQDPVNYTNIIELE